MAIEKPTWIYKFKGDKQTASEMNELAQAVITNATELSNTKDDVADLRNNVTSLDSRVTDIEESGAINKADDDDLENTIINGVPVIREKTIKTYNPDIYSGMGRVIIRKNIVGGVNVLSQSMVNHANTVYEIRYDFDLNGAEIAIPEGSMFKIDGGSLKNGILNCNKTNFINIKNNCFINIKFKGNIINNVVHPSWFGIFPVLVKENIINQQDKFDNLSSFIRCQTDSIINFESGFYGFGGEGDAQEGFVGNKSYSSYRYYALCISGDNIKSLTIIGNNAFFINTVKCHYGAWKRENDVYTKIDDDGTFKYSTIGGGFIFVRPSNPLKNLEIYNIISDYTKERFYGGYVTISPTQSAININTDVDNLIIKHCSLYNNATDGIANVGNSCNNVTIQFCNISNSGRSGISVDTANNIVIDNCNIYYSGDNDFSLSGYRFEGPGCAINAEPTRGHTKNLTITNCNLIGCAYTYISLGYTGKNANENVVINNINAKSVRTGYTITGDRLNQINIIENCPSFIVGNIVKSLNVTGINLTNVMFRLDTIVITNRNSDSNSDKISVNINNVYIKTNHELEILSNGIYPQNRYLLATDFNTSFRSDNIEVTKTTKEYSVNANNISIELVSNTIFKTNINGDVKLNIDNIFVYISESRESGICINSNIYINNGNTTNIGTITVINNSILTKTTTDNFLYRAAKNIKLINDFDSGSSYNLMTIPVDRDLNLARTTNANKWGSYTKPVNFLKFATDDSKERYFGIVGNNPSLLGVLKDDSIIINDTIRSNYKDVLFSLIKSGTYNSFYGIKKGIPYNVLSSLIVTGFTPLNGENVFYDTLKKPMWWNGSKWVDSLGIQIDIKNKGTFAEKPLASSGIPNGFAYFCTDKQTTEGQSNGIIIYHKGVDVWVDALGRVVS